MRETPRTVVITGASDGIGAAAARQLALDGDRVVVVGRTASKVERVASELGADAFVADFADLAQVRALADALRTAYPRIDVLANNAGGLFADHRVTEDGHEITFQVNHLAPFLLTTRLMDLLLASRATIINTSSLASAGGRINLTDPNLTRTWTPFAAYGQSKLANLLFTRGIQKRHGGDGVASAAFHPGIVATNFGETASGVTRWFYRSPLGKRVMVSPEGGADTLVWLATGTPARDWEPGQYYVKRKVRKPNPQALDEALVDALWEKSAELVGG